MDSTKKAKTKETTVHKEKLPCELIEEILSRVPPKFLVCFRIVCKQWNALFDDKTFINNHKSTFRFILTTRSKIYSVSIDPNIVVHELSLDIPGLESHVPNKLVDCNDFLLCDMAKGYAVWNPWLNQTRWIKTDVSQPSYKIDSMGYDNDMRLKEKDYKTILYYRYPTKWKIHDFTSDVWKDVKLSGGSNQGEKLPTAHSRNGVSLNGILYWIAYYDKNDPLYHLVNFNFSRERFFKFCDLPCGMNHPCNALVLRVYKGERFSLLKQCHITKKIEIWVSRNKINYEDGDNVVWRNFMTLSIPNFPSLIETGSNSQPSYFIDDKRLVVCSCDKSGKAWIHVVGENKLISKQIDYVVDPWPLHCTYFPSLIPVPRGQIEEAELQV